MVGNVCNLQQLPPGYYGLPKQGHLIFNASFESGKTIKIEVLTVSNSCYPTDTFTVHNNTRTHTHTYIYHII